MNIKKNKKKTVSILGDVQRELLVDQCKKSLIISHLFDCLFIYRLLDTTHLYSHLACNKRISVMKNPCFITTISIAVEKQKHAYNKSVVRCRSHHPPVKATLFASQNLFNTLNRCHLCVLRLHNDA